MNGRSANTGLLQLLCESIGTMLGSRENERLIPRTLAGRAVLKKVHEKVPLIFFRNTKDDLGDTLSRRITWCNLNFDWLAQHPSRELTDLFRVRRREHEVLSLRR